MADSNLRFFESSEWIESPTPSPTQDPISLTDLLTRSDEQRKGRVKIAFYDGPSEADISPRRHWNEARYDIPLNSIPGPIQLSPPQLFLLDTRQDQPAPLKPRGPCDPPAFLVQPFLRPYNVLTIRSPQHETDSRGLARPSAAEKERRRPRMHLFGLKRSGKTSILRTVFHKENAADTLYLQSTREATKEPKESVINFDVWDHPADFDTADAESSPHAVLTKPGALIFVVDSQDEYYQAISYLVSSLQILARTAGSNPSTPDLPRIPSHISIEVFIHKVDGLSNDFKADIFRDIQQRIAEEMDDVGMDALRTSISFYHTSIYDHSVFEAVSKVYQKLISSMHHATIEALVNSLCANCKMEKAYLFDTQYKFYIASDTHPGDLKSYETCSEYLDVVRDITALYGWRDYDPNAEEKYEDYDLESLVVTEKRGSKYMYMKAINRFITLVCIMSEENTTEVQTFVEHNVTVFQQGLNEVLDRVKVLCV